MWLKNLLNINESKEEIYKNLTVMNGLLHSKANNKSYHCGELETPTLKALRERVAVNSAKKGKLTLNVISADVKALHLDPNNANALFQVASQFNLLEMIAPSISPEMGIERYEHDHTQGPICAIYAGAGTVYRNYFVEVNGKVGQSESNQIDCLEKVGAFLGNDNGSLWEMRNGYALLREEGLEKINKKLETIEVDEVREKLAIGIMWETQVTLNEAIHRVSQAYCSALPIAYVGYSLALWRPFASLVLEASYEATICAGILNALERGNHTVYLTLVGGGAFGNDLAWIVSAIERAVRKYGEYELDVVIVSYGVVPHEILNLIKEYDKC